MDARRYLKVADDWNGLDDALLALYSRQLELEQMLQRLLVIVGEHNGALRILVDKQPTAQGGENA